MGEPAVPTHKQFSDAHHLAESIVQAVEQDTKTPIEVLGGRALASNICTPEKEAEIDHRLLVLAQLVIRQDREILLLRSLAEHETQVCEQTYSDNSVAFYAECTCGWTSDVFALRHDVADAIDTHEQHGEPLSREDVRAELEELRK